MRLGISHLYNKNGAVFLDFINRTNQKDVIAQAVIESIPLEIPRSNLVITDIGAGSWMIASKVLSYIQGWYEYTYYYIEPSQELIAEFKNENTHENVIFVNDFVENIPLSASDIIIASFVFQTIHNPCDLLQRMYDALNPWGTIIIVNQNRDTPDFKLKNLFWYSFADITPHILSELGTLSIECSYEARDSHFYGVQDILSLNEAWKNCVSFLLFRDFEHIAQNELEKVQDYVREHLIEGKLIRKEDYIFIRK